MRVLLVEDDSTVAKSIQLMLQSDGYIVDSTDLGEDGLEIGKLYDYDIIILDLMLPDIDGYEVLRRLRAARVTTPILILSGLGELDQLHRVGDLGFQLQHGLDAVGEEGPLAHQLLGVGGVVPEGRVLGERVQLGQAMLGGIPVKDASSAARRTA